MLLPGAYFRDEAIWRGRMIAFACDLKALLFELGFWVGAMYLAYPVSKWWEPAPLVVGGLVCLRMLLGYFDERRGPVRVSKDIDSYVDQAYPAPPSVAKSRRLFSFWK